ncbi:hypothetical protein [Pseudonocardia charpentierae]|uniref:Uncharacterized protein n=1 Tax=Pseudonocardia charpentierae TaxID=3075545 RepID=A0ABU2NIA3_9PSEU|nr:hypothetical protein [Pseudonocardia sp. DSM 45834]MDT0352964.1 hypothetical protein [Pseudonocardia sp. DSM 45834]
MQTLPRAVGAAFLALARCAPLGNIRYQHSRITIAPAPRGYLVRVSGWTAVKQTV